jgi:hypothetical protein
MYCIEYVLSLADSRYEDVHDLEEQVERGRGCAKQRMRARSYEEAYIGHAREAS